MSSQADLFELARENDQEVNELLADTDGRIATMQYHGSIGYHLHVARGATDPQYLWKIALLKALDESLLEMVHIDAETVSGATSQLQRQLAGDLQHASLELLTDRFSENLWSLIETQEEMDGDAR